MDKSDKGTPNGGRRILIVFYSHSGNTRTLARLIRQQAGGDLIEILPVIPYPVDYDAVVKQAKLELTTDYQPPLKTTVANLECYNIILIGSPNWWNTLAPPLHTLLAQGNFTGKAIAPFITHEGGRMSDHRPVPLRMENGPNEPAGSRLQG